MNIGYARCSTDKQDLTAQKELLIGLGVERWCKNFCAFTFPRKEKDERYS